ncbi:hypothetical protein HELRODRAFT_171133 [Helobdella robusta]|uniref:Cilia- and flagella-associated protein 43 n=1 Tax=Helobdella robusta TaxID=6412 RepID=T1F3U2_HELRO|nr:hypothetical protein HELRODRAFT_171133 [Helobdella robusta]ESO05496.1 hypothetical protein HELRODRAFT_171133 [Helobdella robusta]
MAIVKAKAFYNFGFSQISSGNINFIDDVTMMFPSGTCCILLNMEYNTQRTINSGTDGNSITAMAVNLKKRVLAFAELKKDQVPVIFVYDFDTCTQHKVIFQTAIDASSYTSLAFSSNGKYLAAVGLKSQNEYYIFMWLWDRAHLFEYYEIDPDDLQKRKNYTVDLHK